MKNSSIKKLHATRYTLYALHGQAITEIIIALAIVGIIITTAVAAISIVLRSNLEAEQGQSAALLGAEYSDIIQNLAIGNWDMFYSLDPKGSTSTYRIAASGTAYVVQSGNSTTTLDQTVYTRYFSIENVSRDGSNNIESVYNSSNDDPSTQKITVYMEWTRGGATRTTTIVKYITRSRNQIFLQTEWSGTSATDTVLTAPDNTFATSTSIDITSSTGSIILEGY